jgi:hypothetical protein
MGQQQIFLPMGALAFLTFFVLLQVPIRRVAAARRGLVKTADFRFGESAAVPGNVSIPNRNYMNLLELPVLFYIGALMYEIAGKVDGLVLTVAWSYVACRAAHSIIHLTYNHVFHRLAAFTASNVALIFFWILFFIR